MNDNRVTIADVAKYAGVSTATVGRVVGGYGTVSIKTRERVMSAISALGYSPNVVAQGLRSKKTKTIAVIVGSVSNSFFASMVSAIEKEAARYGYNVIICNTNEDVDVEMRHIVNLQARMVDGIILSSACPQSKLTDEKKAVYCSDTPIVLVDRRVDGLDLDMIESENTAAGYKTTNYLLALGHRKIGIIGTGEDQCGNCPCRIRKKCYLRPCRTGTGSPWMQHRSQPLHGRVCYEDSSGSRSHAFLHLPDRDRWIRSVCQE